MKVNTRFSGYGKEEDGTSEQGYREEGPELAKEQQAGSFRSRAEK